VTVMADALEEGSCKGWKAWVRGSFDKIREFWD